MTDTLSQAALSLSAFPLSTIAKATVILAAGLLTIRCARRARAATRHFVLASTFAVVLALPVAELSVPAVTLSVRTPVAPAAPETLPIVMSPDFTASQAAPERARSIDAGRSESRRPSTEALFIAAWAIGGALFLTPLLVTPGRLRQLRGTARRWHEGEELVRAIGSGVHRPIAPSASSPERKCSGPRAAPLRIARPPIRPGFPPHPRRPAPDNGDENPPPASFHWPASAPPPAAQ